MWGCIEERTDSGEFVAYHVVPMIRPDPEGEAIMSAAHDLSSNCQCHPFLDHGNGGWDIWEHHDPDHPGALPESDYSERRSDVRRQDQNAD
jgi:hypothetical protein